IYYVIEPPHPKRNGDSQAQPALVVIDLGVTFPGLWPRYANAPRVAE
ncbi:MAG: hypothetical protein F6K50_24660, partial [Moorea sp. SIO3I7]|nr:hypothetical protein [Moorena sp. SIO3I7]